MEDKAQVLFDGFCHDMDFKSHYEYHMELKKIMAALKLRKGNDLVERLKCYKKEITENLEKSEYLLDLSPERYESEMTEGLHSIFTRHFFTEFKKVKYDELLDKSEYIFDLPTGTLTVNSKPFADSPYPMVDFSLLDRFKPVVQHLVWIKLFIQLENLEKDIKEEKEIDDGITLSMKPSSEQLVYLNVNAYPKSKKEFNQPLTLKELPHKQIESVPLYLCDVFESTSRYNHIMGILVEKQLIREGTHIWIDEKKNRKKYLVVILKQLHSLGYYKDNKKLSNRNIIEISQNTFGLEIKIDTVKKTPHDHFTINYLPLASTMVL